MDTDYLITREQLQHLLHEVLELTDDDMSLLQTNRLQFLHKLNKAYEQSIPFQNLSFTCVPFAERHMPTMQENIDNVISGIGGLCWTLNSVLFVILKELGFDALLISGSIVDENRAPHVMVLVSNVDKTEATFLMDVGFAAPAHDPIPLDFAGESPQYNVAHLVLRWVKRGDQYIRQELYHSENGYRVGEPEGEWEPTVIFTLHSRSWSVIKGLLEKKVFACKDSMLNGARMIIGKSKSTNKFVQIVNLKMKKEENGRTLQKVLLQDDKAVVLACKEHFPNFPLSILCKSYQIWQLTD